MNNQYKFKYKICKLVNINIWGNALKYRLKKKIKRSKLYRTKSLFQLSRDQINVFKHFYGRIDNKYLKKHFDKIKRPLASIEFIERRIDIVIYRLNLVSSVTKGHALIQDGAIFVNGRLINRKYKLLKDGDIITVSPQSYSKVFYSIINNMRKRKYYSSYPNYMIFSYKLLRGIFLYTPFNKEVPVPFTITNSLYRKKDIFNKKGSKRLYKKRHRFKVSVNWIRSKY
jgi:ribosomal protein S4